MTLFRDLRGSVPAANDGIIATAGVVEGFIAAGAGTDALIAAALAATVAGAVSFGGFKYGEAAGERDAELAVVEEERRDLARSPQAELEELANYYEARGVDPALAREVAAQVSARDALTAQLESEHGIRDLMPANAPLLEGVRGAVAFMMGAVLPIAMVLLVPPESRSVATAVAVILSLVLTAALTARLGRSSLRRAVLRSVLVGVLTLLLSVIAGSFLPDPDGEAGPAPGSTHQGSSLEENGGTRRSPFSAIRGESAETCLIVQDTVGLRPGSGNRSRGRFR